jgi:hypothetical protein
VIQVGSSGFGPQRPVNRIAFHHVGTMGPGVVDGGAQQDFCHTAAPVAPRDHKAGHGPHSAGAPGVRGPALSLRGCFRKPENPGTEHAREACPRLHRAPTHRLSAPEGEDAW